MRGTKCDTAGVAGDPGTKMGCARSRIQEVGTTTFPERYTAPLGAKIHDIEIGGFTDVWGAITMAEDWSVRRGSSSGQRRETFKRLLHTYMQQHVCAEPHIVLIYGTQTWVFNTRYNTGSNAYRVIQL